MNLFLNGLKNSVVVGTIVRQPSDQRDLLSIYDVPSRRQFNVDPNQAVVRTGEGMNARQLEERIGRFGPEHARLGDSEIGRRQHIVNAEIAGARMIRRVAGIVGWIAEVA